MIFFLHVNPPQSPELPPDGGARYTRGEVMLTCLCWSTPGIAIALIFVACVDWFRSLMSPHHLWHEVVIYGTVAAIFFACSGFAGAIHAAKSDPEKRVRRIIEFALVFLLGQIIVAPVLVALLGALLLQIILR